MKTTLLFTFFATVLCSTSLSAADIDAQLKNAAYTSQWKKLPDDFPVQKVMVIVAHNAFANPTDGPFTYTQQGISLTQQLELGVRGLMLDLYAAGNDILLCHGNCETPRVRPSETPVKVDISKYQKFPAVLKTIYDWLSKNKDEVLFVFLESYVGGPDIDKAVESLPNLAKMTVTVGDWNTFKFGQKDVTYGELRKANKRLFIFNSNVQTKYAPLQWPLVAENMYSSTDQKVVCTFRGESEDYKANKRPFMVFNCFGEWAETPAAAMKTNSAKNLRTLMTNCRTAFGRDWPNFITLDQVQVAVLQKGDSPFDLANSVNEETAKALKKPEAAPSK